MRANPTFSPTCPAIPNYVLHNKEYTTAAQLLREVARFLIGIFD
jgi:hypothetical protein